MPEIVEIKKYCDLIKKYCINKKVKTIKILKGRYKKHGKFDGYNDFNKELPLKIVDVNSKGKFIYITFEKDFTLYCTLGLSGGWTYKKKDSNTYKFPEVLEFLNIKNENAIEEYRDTSLEHLNIEFIFEKGSLYFFDTLSYGTISVSNDKTKLEKKLKSLGPDIMDEDLTYEMFNEQINKKVNLNKKIGNVLVNQKIISGIGNYLRADILWIAKISPHRLVKNLENIELKHIFQASRDLTWGDYDIKEGKKLKIISKKPLLPHNFKRDFFVYYEDEDINGNKIKKEELYEGSQKRMIYWVPDVQK
jgi:formamidopyrimidine-DNA glycosylase